MSRGKQYLIVNPSHICVFTKNLHKRWPSHFDSGHISLKFSVMKDMRALQMLG